MYSDGVPEHKTRPQEMRTGNKHSSARSHGPPNARIHHSRPDPSPSRCSQKSLQRRRRIAKIGETAPDLPLMVAVMAVQSPPPDSRLPVVTPHELLQLAAVLSRAAAVQYSHSTRIQTGTHCTALHCTTLDFTTTPPPPPVPRSTLHAPGVV